MMIEFAPRSGNGSELSFEDGSARFSVDDAEVSWNGSVAEDNRRFGRGASETELIDANV